MWLPAQGRKRVNWKIVGAAIKGQPWKWLTSIPPTFFAENKSQGHKLTVREAGISGVVNM